MPQTDAPDRDLYISGVAYKLGTLHPISTLPELKEQPKTLDLFTKLDLQQYSRIETDPVLLAEECLQETLTQVGIEPASIDALIIGSSTVLSHFDVSYFKQFFKKTGLVNAFLAGVTLGECANLVTALQLAESLIKNKRGNHVLVLLLDVIKSGRSRIVPPNTSVYSDAAVSFLISGTATSDLRLVAMTTHVDNGIWALDDPSQYLKYMQAFTLGTQRILDKVQAEIGIRLQQIDRFIISNYNKAVTDLFRHLIKAPADRFFTDNIRRIAHTYSCDNMINLKDLCDNMINLKVPHDPAKPAKVSQAENLLLLPTGIGVWGAILVVKNPPAGGPPKPSASP